MLKNCCGKNCMDCTQKDILNCPGCMDGPGKRYSEDCDLAECCREKGHETCETCGFGSTCTLLRKREEMPENRKRKQEAELAKKAAELAKKEAFAKDAAVLGKWLWLLFWLIVPSSIVSLISADSIGELYPKLYFIGQILSAVCSALYGFILLQLVKQEPMYKTAGILVIITSAASAAIVLISATGEPHQWTLIISLPAAIAAFVSEYYEFMAHSSVVNYVNRELALKWEQLWKWYIRCYIAIIAAIAVTIIVPIAGIIVVFCAAIGIAVVSITKLVYVYRTAKLFREYSAAA